ncbi:hypothetical protein [Saccharibacillus alkalitolerans]|uniref:Uncharacterized protein n=1 Tax=Saccharibacillus alkalitolerans TaxID=2705290 RepID=A0ABX0F5L6_9BACL|nr:hypothetical protein [Saccharibacillus alkalitolerans]NGZ76022.1 hypothetical protein [Saccharibacillus alkalitolerans]
MAKSAARKLRDKRIREGKFDAAELRSPYASADLRTRRTKTKQETLEKIKHKGRYKNPNFTGGDEGSFCIPIFLKKGLTKKSRHAKLYLVETLDVPTPNNVP